MKYNRIYNFSAGPATMPEPVLEEIRERFGLEHTGAFTFADNTGSIRVLEKNGFRLTESFTEGGRASGYYLRSSMENP